MVREESCVGWARIEVEGREVGVQVKEWETRTSGVLREARALARTEALGPR